MVQHKEILYMEMLIVSSKFDYDYDIPLHSSNYEKWKIKKKYSINHVPYALGIGLITCAIIWTKFSKCLGN